MTRRHWLSLGLSAAVARGEAPAGTYAADIEFLLNEAEQKATTLLTLKKIDWAAVRKQFTAEVAEVQNEAAFLKLVQRLLARLQDGHAVITEAKEKWPDESGGRRWTGPRVHLLVIEPKVYVRTAFGPAAEAGLASGQEILAIEGQPAREWLRQRQATRAETESYSTAHQALYATCHWGLADWSGTPISFTVRTADGAEKSHRIVRQGGPNFVPLGPIFPPQGLKTQGRSLYGQTASGLGYLHLRDVPGDLDQQLDTMLSAIGPVPGLILDLRANGGGGCDHAAVFGRFVAQGKFYDRYEGQSAHAHTGHLVVLIDAGVRSAGETIAAMFKETRRALVLGDTPTAGMSSQKASIAVPSGRLTVRLSIASNMARANKGQGIEGLGIAPHVTLAYDPADLRAKRDSLLLAAEKTLQSGFPHEEVDYRPPQ